uniref:Uncharacterized protein n=1 Tax=Panagrolaimus sp. ES5 TaxID=591445 RepID=A0AC34F0K0_9BILA
MDFYDKSRNLICYIYKCGCNCHGLKLNSYDVKTNKFIGDQHIEDLENFSTNPPNVFKNKVKGIVIDDSTFSSSNNELSRIQFRQSIAKKLSKLQIPFVFITNGEISATTVILAASLQSKLEDTVMTIFTRGQRKDLLIFSFFRKNDGYLFQNSRTVEIDQGLTGKEINEEIFKYLKPTKIIFVTDQKADKKFVKLIRTSVKNCILLENWISNYLAKGLREIVKHIYDKNENQYHIIQTTFAGFGVSDNEMLTPKDMIFTTKLNQVLPLTKTCTISRNSDKIYLTVSCKSKKTFLPLDELIVKEKCHKIQLNLSIDENHLPTFHHEAIILPEIKRMPQNLNQKNTNKIPIIGFFDNLSVICLWNKTKKCYEFSKLWNEMYGKDLFLDFSFQKPKLSSAVLPLQKFLVYDLLKIMSMTKEELKITSSLFKWGFEITEDDENPVLLKFETFDKIHNAASPAFLMALILKKHKKIIRKETGEKPTKLGLCVFENYKDSERKKRVETGLQESCELLKIGFMMVEE